jgi:hypothetical protein
MELRTYLTEVLGLKRAFAGARTREHLPPSSVKQSMTKSVWTWTVVDTQTEQNEALLVKVKESLSLGPLSQNIVFRWIEQSTFEAMNFAEGQVVLLSQPAQAFGKSDAGVFYVPSPSLMSEGIEQEIIESKRLCWKLLKQWKDFYAKN